MAKKVWTRKKIKIPLSQILIFYCDTRGYLQQWKPNHLGVENKPYQVIAALSFFFLKSFMFGNKNTNL